MAKDTGDHVALDDLTDAEIERIEALLFCAGGPPSVVGAAMAARAAGVLATRSMTRAR